MRKFDGVGIVRTMSETPQAIKVSRLGACVLAALGASVMPGCLERTIVVTSEPPGAVVWLNDQELGRTPVETDFTFYGTYDVRLRLEGYEPLVTSRVASAPIYEVPGLDIFAEAVPAKIATRLEWHFDLVPLPERAQGADAGQLRTRLLDRAGELRKQTAEKQE